MPAIIAAPQAEVEGNRHAVDGERDFPACDGAQKARACAG
jgi:hypothetical protein